MLRKRPSISFTTPAFLSSYHEYCTLVQLVELTSQNSPYSISGEDLATLYSPGIIVIWSIDKINDQVITLKEVKSIELYKKPIISKKVKSKFEKNVTYFENNIFSDAALQELHTVKSTMDQAQNLIFIDLLFDGDLLIAVSNQNFVITITMGLQNDTKKVIVTDAFDAFSAIRITSAMVYRPGMILISLSDGTVKLQKIVTRKDNNSEDGFDGDDGLDENKKNEELIGEKSCAIQNIVLNERKFYESAQAKRNLDSLETWNEGQSSTRTKCNELSSLKNEVERVFIHGSYFSRSSIRNLNVLESEAIYFVDEAVMKVYDLVGGQLSIFYGKDDDQTKGMSLSKNGKGKAHFMVNIKFLFLLYLITLLKNVFIFFHQVTYGDHFIHLHREASTSP